MPKRSLLPLVFVHKDGLHQTPIVPVHLINRLHPDQGKTTTSGLLFTTMAKSEVEYLTLFLSFDLVSAALPAVIRCSTVREEAYSCAKEGTELRYSLIHVHHELKLYPSPLHALPG